MNNIWNTWQHFRLLRGHQHYGGNIIHQPEADAAPLPDEFCLLVWNIFKGCKGAAFERDMLAFADQANVLCLQEVMFDTQPQLPAPLMPMSWDYSPSYQRNDGIFEGVITLGKHAMADQGMRLASLGSEPVMATSKSAIATTFRCANGHSLLVINIHMLLFRRLAAAAAELAQLIDHMEETEPDAPVLVVGDFNTLFPHQLRHLDDVMDAEGLSRVTPTFEPRKLMRLDHIYARNIKNAELTIRHGIDSSDHPALLCQIRL